MVSNGYGQQFEWALERLRQEFGEERVSMEVSDGGRSVDAYVAPAGGGEGEGRDPYRMILKDPVLGDVNRVADPQAFVEAEVGYARSWCAGESKRARTFG